MKTVTNVLWADRHSDATVYVFSDAAQAVSWAREQAHKYDRFGELEEREGDTLSFDWKRLGCIYIATYGESNSLRVETKTIDKELGT